MAKKARKSRGATGGSIEEPAKKTKKPVSQSAIDELIRKHKGKNAVECDNLKSCLNPKYHRYVFVGLSDGSVLNCNLEAMAAHVMPSNSGTAKKWRARQAAQRKRDEAKLAREQEKAAKAKKAEAK